MSTCMSGSPQLNGLRLDSSFWLLSERRRPRSRRSLWARSYDVDALRIRIEHDLRLAALQLAIYMGQLLLQGKFALPVVSALAQHKRLYDTLQRISGKVRVVNEHRFFSLVVIVNWRQFLSIPAYW